MGGERKRTMVRPSACGTSCRGPKGPLAHRESFLYGAGGEKHRCLGSHSRTAGVKKKHFSSTRSHSLSIQPYVCRQETRATDRNPGQLINSLSQNPITSDCSSIEQNISSTQAADLQRANAAEITSQSTGLSDGGFHRGKHVHNHGQQVWMGRTLNGTW